MSMDALIKTVSQAAPLLGGILGGPAGAAIGSLIANKFGGSSDNPDDLAARIQADPQAAEKLLEIQSNNQVELEKIHMQMASNALKYDSIQKLTEYHDRDSARQREVELAKSGKRDLTANILAYSLTAGTFCALAYLFMGDVPEDNKEVIVTMISTLNTVWVGAMGYYFGSLSADKKKIDDIKKI